MKTKNKSALRQRLTGVFWLALTCLAFSAFVAPGGSITIQVPAIPAWTQTPIHLNAGDTVTLAAAGTWSPELLVESY
jgi:hypothetical protein